MRLSKLAIMPIATVTPMKVPKAIDEISVYTVYKTALKRMVVIHTTHS